MSGEAFKPGDRVRDSRGQTVTVSRGPLRSWCGDLYEVGGAPDGVEPWIEHGESLEHIPADPRVEVVAAAAFESRAGRPWGEASGVPRSLWRDTARAILAALDAHADAAKRPQLVRDAEGDVWERQENGEYTCWDAGGWVATYQRLTEKYGPLTEVA